MEISPFPQVPLKLGECQPLFAALDIYRQYACRLLIGSLNASWLSLSAALWAFPLNSTFALLIGRQYVIAKPDELAHLKEDASATDAASATADDDDGDDAVVRRARHDVMLKGLARQAFAQY